MAINDVNFMEQIKCISAFCSWIYPNCYFAIIFSHGSNSFLLDDNLNNVIIYDQTGKSFVMQIVNRSKDFAFILIMTKKKVADDLPYYVKSVFSSEKYLTLVSFFYIALV